MPELYTPSEAAAVVGAPVKDVNNLIDKGILPGTVVKRSGPRRLTRSALPSLKVALATSDLLTVEGRRELARRVAAKPARRNVRVRGLSMDVGEMVAAAWEGLDRLDRARSMVASDPEIMAGTPVFKGTRISVHAIAAMLANGVRIDEIRKAYPRLTRAKIGLAPIFAKAYPLRGRPRHREIDRLSLVASNRVRLTDLPEAPGEIPHR